MTIYVVRYSCQQDRQTKHNIQNFAVPFDSASLSYAAISYIGGDCMTRDEINDRIIELLERIGVIPEMIPGNQETSAPANRSFS